MTRAKAAAMHLVPAWLSTGLCYLASMIKSLLSLVVTSLVLVGCSEAPKPAEPPAAKPKVDLNNNSSGNPVTAPVDYLGAIAKAKKKAEGGVETAALTQQVQLFYSQEGRYPKDLNELVTLKYLSALPQPPYNMKFSYDAKTGEVKVVPQ